MNLQSVSTITSANMTREEWLKERKKGIGGSDAAAIMGANPYSSPLTVYLDKLNLLPEKEISEAMRQGTDLEEYVAKRFVEASGKKVRNCNKILVSNEYPWMLANIDRTIVGEDAGLECKTTSIFNKHDFESGEVPVTYQWQCQHYMAVTGCQRWYLAVLVLSKGFYIYQVDRNDQLIKLLIDEERAFWEEHVLKNIPPLPIGIEADDDALEILYPQSSEDTADLTSVSATLDWIEIQKKNIETLEKSIEAAKQEIKQALGECERGINDKFRVSWKTVNSSRLDTKALKKDYPEIAEKYMINKSSRVFRIDKIKI